MNTTHFLNLLPTDNSSTVNFSTAQRTFFNRYYSHFITFIVVANLICVFALISNVICLVAIYTYPRLRQRGNILVGNLVVLNILVSLIVYPISIVSPVYRQYYDLAANFCDWTFFYYFMVQSFVWHECFLSINRFIALVVPHYYTAISRKRNLVLTVILGYLIPFSVNAYGLRGNLYASTLPFGGCRFSPDISVVYPLFQSVLGIYLPMCMVGMCYLIIFMTARMRKRRLYDSAAPAEYSLVRQTRRMRVAKMLFVSFLWNTLTYIPQPILSAFLKDLYNRYPPAFFFVRYALCLGLAGNVVSSNINSVM